MAAAWSCVSRSPAIDIFGGSLENIPQHCWFQRKDGVGKKGDNGRRWRECQREGPHSTSCPLRSGLWIIVNSPPLCSHTLSPSPGICPSRWHVTWSSVKPASRQFMFPGYIPIQSTVALPLTPPCLRTPSIDLLHSKLSMHTYLLLSDSVEN